jgi:hypothetical protein
MLIVRIALTPFALIRTQSVYQDNAQVDKGTSGRKACAILRHARSACPLNRPT